MSTLPALLMDLGRAGAEVEADPRHQDRIRFRPAALPTALVARLRLHKSAIRSLLDGASALDEDALYVFEERLGVAVLLGMPTHPGSPAWAIAVAEATAEPSPTAPSEAGSPLRAAARAIATIAQDTLGVPVRVHLATAGTRFPGEPDWGALPKLRPLGGPQGSCHLCGGRRWWRLTGQSMYTCSACHPPAPGLLVEQVRPDDHNPKGAIP